MIITLDKNRTMSAGNNGDRLSCGYPHLRKCRCMFSRGPQLPDMGVWRSAELQ